MVVGLMHQDVPRIAMIRNCIKGHEGVTVLMYEKSQAAQKSKSRKVVLPFGVPKPGSRDEKKMLEQVAEPLGEGGPGELGASLHLALAF